MLILVSSISGCSPRAYLLNRARDLGDIGFISLGKGYGAEARVGPVHAGLAFISDGPGLRHGYMVGPLAETGGVLDGIIPFPNIEGTIGDGSHFFAVDEFKPDFDPLIGNASVWERRERLLYERGKAYRAVSNYPFLATDVSYLSPMDEDTGPRNKPIINPYYTGVEVGAGLFISVRAGLNPGEALDFLLGWLGIDLLGDDIEQVSPSGAPGSGASVE